MTDYGYGFGVETGANNYFTAGINHNVTLEKVVMEPAKKDGTGQNVLRFYFKNEDGASFVHTEFPVNEELVRSWALRDRKDPKQELAKAYGAVGTRVKHIMSAVRDVSTVVINGKDASGRTLPFEEIVPQFINAFNEVENLSQIKLDLLLVYNNKGMLSLPRYTYPPFIQNAEVAKQHPEKALFIGRKHKIKPPAPTNETSMNSDFSTAAAQPAAPMSNSFDNSEQTVLGQGAMGGNEDEGLAF